MLILESDINSVTNCFVYIRQQYQQVKVLTVFCISRLLCDKHFFENTINIEHFNYTVYYPALYYIFCFETRIIWYKEQYHLLTQIIFVDKAIHTLVFLDAKLTAVFIITSRMIKHLR